MAVNRASKASSACAPVDLVKNEFERMSKTLWAQEVCPSLIYSKVLNVCTGCLGFFYDDDTSSAHPKAQVTQITKLCMESGVSTEEQFFTAMWAEGVKLSKMQGLVLMPRMSSEHRDPPKNAEKMKEAVAQWSQGRVHLLEHELQASIAERDKLLRQVKTLEVQVADLLTRMIEDSSEIHRTKLEASSHIEALHRLLHPDGCRCPNAQISTARAG